MNRIQSKFKELKKKDEKALITFITAGDPNLSATERLVYEMEKAGADIIELGVPFSDPMADGPVIQRSSERALKGKTYLSSILNLVKKFRKNTEIPIILMGYFNPILQWGCERFCHQAAEAGVDGLIVVDLPPEESAELQVPARKSGLNLIYLLTPTADEARIRHVKRVASGFVYYVSVTGITGSAVKAFDSIKNHVAEIKKSISLPVCIGFGIRTPQDAHTLSKIADGVVVGSALVSLLEKGKMTERIQSVGRKVKSLKKAIKIDSPLLR
jgi:tryptophan synthase alpha chain